MESSKLRHWLGIIAVIPITLVVLYLGGLIGQLIVGYQKWLSQDGMMGGVPMDAVIIEPLYCIG